MIPQYTAAALVNECKVLATPASVEQHRHLPAPGGPRQHGWHVRLQAREILDNCTYVLAIELLTAAQAIDLNEGLALSPATGPIVAELRDEIPTSTATAPAPRHRTGRDIGRAGRALVRRARRAMTVAPRIVDDDAEPGAELWPGGGVPVYDAFVYHLMSHDEVRNAPYRQALAETAPAGWWSTWAPARTCCGPGRRRGRRPARLRHRGARGRRGPGRGARR